MEELLRQIQTDAADSKTEISDVLRKCRILATRLGLKEFKDWVDFELNGYPEGADVPAYRVVSAPAVGWFAGGFGASINEVPLPSIVLDKKHRDFAERSFLREPIGAYSDLAKKSAKGGLLESSWPANLILLYGRKFYQGYGLMKAVQRISSSAMIGIIESVRNKVLAFTLDVESSTPEITEMKPLQGAAHELASQVFHTHIYGDVGNVSAGGTNFSQNAVMQVNKGDWESLNKALSDLGLTEPDLNELKGAIEQDGSANGKFGSKTSRWLGSMMEKAAAGTWEVALSTAGTMLPKLLSSYFGLPL